MSHWRGKITSFTSASGMQMMRFLKLPGCLERGLWDHAMICFHTESRPELEKNKKHSYRSFKAGFSPGSKSRSWTQRRWVWIMDAVADEQQTQNESTEDWMRHERMDRGRGGEGMGGEGGRGGGWVEFRRVMGQLLVRWQWSPIDGQIMWFCCHEK